MTPQPAPRWWVALCLTPAVLEVVIVAVVMFR